MAEAHCDHDLTITQPTSSASRSGNCLHSSHETQTDSASLNADSFLASQFSRSSLSVLSRIKIVTFRRLRKLRLTSSPEPELSEELEASASTSAVQASRCPENLPDQTEEKSWLTSKNHRRKKILSHLCAAPAESEGESSVGQSGSNIVVNTCRLPSRSTSSTCRPLFTSNRLLVADRADEKLEFAANSRSSRPIQSQHNNEANKSSNLIRQQIAPVSGNEHVSSSSATATRSPEFTVTSPRQLDESVLPYPYLSKLSDSETSALALCNKTGTRALPSRIHTQIDFVHCLVPDLLTITNLPFYWLKIDRYEAEKLLENKPEGTFLLRDSAQEDYLYSVSYRRFQRSRHARIEQFNDRFSFDFRDPAAFSSSTVVGLIEHYKDASHCMDDGPMLILPLHRTLPFSLKHLSRATICSLTTYDSVFHLPLPKPLKYYLQEYHYRKKVDERRFDCTAS